MLSQEALERMLGIREHTLITPDEMASRLNVTFYSRAPKAPVSTDVLAFVEKLKELFIELHVNIVPYEESLYLVPWSKVIVRFLGLLFNDVAYGFQRITQTNPTRHFITWPIMRRILRRQKIRSGITVITLGEYEDGDLPIDNVSSFRKSSVITITDTPAHISKASDFYQHFDTALALFAHHMTNIVILVRGTEWILYNFNASHPFYDTRNHFKEDVLYGLIPKVVAPIRPLRFSDFTHIKQGFDHLDDAHAPFARDMVESARLLEETKLYPPGKKIADLPFRSDFYRWIGALHLDNRSGMSYGFLARQLPTSLPEVFTYEQAEERFGPLNKEKDYFIAGGHLYILVQTHHDVLCMRVPEVWVLSQRSGANKTNMDPARDLVKLGLKDGVLLLQAPKGMKIRQDYRPSFDTGVILAHALGNAIVASLMEYLQPGNGFSDRVKHSGAAIAHWHGYMDPSKIPTGWFVYGEDNPHVSCSSPQASLYAIEGKLRSFDQANTAGNLYRGDVHIEPHHGSNMTHYSLAELAQLLSSQPDIATLGNKHFDKYFDIATS